MNCRKCGAELPDGAGWCWKCGRKQTVERSVKKRGNGQGTARKRGNTWTGYASGYSFVTPDGKRHTRRPSKGGFRTKAEALAWASSQNGETFKDAPVPKLIDLWTGWSENDMLKLSDTKQTAFKIARRRLESIIGREIDTLTVDDLQAVINKECTSYYTAKDVKTLLSHLYKRAMASNTNRGRITQNLSEFLVLPDYEEKEAVPFSQDELKVLWDSYDAGNRFAAYILLMCYTGMMPAEIMACKKDMIDLASCEIRGAGVKTNVRKKSVIAFPEFLKPVIEDLMESKPSNGAKDRGKIAPINRDNFYDEFYESIEKAGISNPAVKGTDGKERHRLTPYSCRHTYGTEAVKAGFHPEMIKKMLRHSSTKTQERYTHLGGDDLHDAVNKIKKTVEAPS